MKFTWRPIKNIYNLPKGVDIAVSMGNHYVDYITSENGGFEYINSGRVVQKHKLEAFTHYMIIRPFQSQKELGYE